MSYHLRKPKTAYFLFFLFFWAGLCFLGCKKKEEGRSVTFDLVRNFNEADVLQETNTIHFGDKNSGRFLLNGWSNIEKNGTWADSLTSTLKFFTYLPSSDRRIAIECFPYSFPGSPPQVMELHLNENRVDSCELSAKIEKYLFLLPGEALRKGENILAFKFKYAGSPSGSSGGKSKRTLAVRFITLTFLNKKKGVKNAFSEKKNIFLNPLCQINYDLKLPEEPKLELDSRLSGSKKENKNRDLKLKIFVTEAENKENDAFEVSSRIARKKTSSDLDLARFGGKIVRISLRIDPSAEIPEEDLTRFSVKLSKLKITGKREKVFSGRQIKKLSGRKLKEDKTNLLLVVLDGVNLRHMSCYGYQRETTPFIDRLSKEGFLFTRAYAQTSWTIPSITSFFTSTSPLTHKVWALDKKLSDEAFTLAEALKEEGFTTCALTASIPASTAYNLLQGFEEIKELYREEKQNLRSGLRKQVVWAEDFLKPGLEWLKKNKEKQFFMYLHFLQPHEPYNPPSPFDDEFRPLYEGVLKKEELLVPKDLKAENLAKKDLDFLQAAYDGNLKYADYYVGKFLRGLQEMGLYENTIVIITADHGESFMEHGQLGHSKTLFEEEIQIPLIIRFPKKYGLGGRKIDALVQSMDLMPTLMDIYAARKNRSVLQGKNIFPLLSGEKKEIHDFILAALDWRKVLKEPRVLALISQKYKLILTGSTGLLFDLLSDPAEKENIYEKGNILTEYFEKRLFRQKNKYLSQGDLVHEGPLSLDEKEKEQLKALGYIN
ncbi:sulfatase [Acidobacteriota bacterium]